MKSSILIAAIISAICGCVPLNSKSLNTPVDIKPSQFADYYLGFVSNGKFEQYTFGEEGDSILCSRGGDGETLGLVYDWRIIDGKTLLLTTKKGVNAKVLKIKVIEGNPFISQVGEIEFSKIDNSMKTVRLQFSEITNKRAVTIDGKVFKKEKY